MPFYTQVHLNTEGSRGCADMLAIHRHDVGVGENPQEDPLVIRWDLWHDGSTWLQFFETDPEVLTVADMRSLANAILQVANHRYRLDSKRNALDALADAALDEGGPSVAIGTALAEAKQRQAQGQPGIRFVDDLPE